jgi:hypothetical protein
VRRGKPSPADPGKWLGASGSVGSAPIAFYVPSRDRHGRPIAHDVWVTIALETFGRLFRGATAYPRSRGVWRDDANGGTLRLEEPTIVTCYADPLLLQRPDVQTALRAFVRRVGRETNQGEVGIVIDSNYYAITEFESATSG